jgi:hypothetical protein
MGVDLRNHDLDEGFYTPCQIVSFDDKGCRICRAWVLMINQSSVKDL